MAGMELINGVYYTPEDLARKREREAAAEARRQAAAADVVERVGVAQVEISDDRIRGILTELLEPVIEAVDDVEKRLTALEGVGTAEGGAETAEEKAPEGNTPEGSDTAASGASSAAPAKPTTTKKAVKK